MSETNDQVWREPELARAYLEGVRGGIPLAEEQLRILLHIVQAERPGLRRFLDLGCGDGILGRVLLDAFPLSHGVFIDFSEAMLLQADERLRPYGARAQCFLRDYGPENWLEGLDLGSGFDVVVSGFSIHHQPNARKRTLYRQIYQCLVPGGLFLNLEHVASTSTSGTQLFDDYFIDSLYRYHRTTGGQDSRETIAQRYYHRDDKSANILERVEFQCDWLRAIGFEGVDCFFKVFELALFGGVKPV